MASGKVVPVVLAVLALAGCAANPGTPSATPVTSTRTQVDWSGYAASYQQIIDEETAEGDCTALQDMFDVAPDDPDLLSYIDESLRIADCY